MNKLQKKLIKIITGMDVVDVGLEFSESYLKVISQNGKRGNEFVKNHVEEVLLQSMRREQPFDFSFKNTVRGRITFLKK